MYKQSAESYILLKTIHNGLQEGFVVESTHDFVPVDEKIILGVGHTNVNVINEFGDIFTISGSNTHIDSVLESVGSHIQETKSILAPIRETVTGPRGVAGTRGDQGNIGPQGPQGPMGEIGPQGVQGDHGSHGEIGSTGIGMQSVDNLDSTTMLVHLTDKSVFSVSLPVGPSGLDGVRGSVGERGSTGDIGPVGPKGPSGKDGVDGSEGLVGPVGPIGLGGKAGARGEKGERGSTGGGGERGVTGSGGERGPQGERGSVGKRGTRGERGTDGLVGSPGKVGKRGLRGFAGKTGDSGVVKARFPLKYDKDKKELSFDSKSLEKVLNIPNVDPMAINNLLTAIGGGGAVGIRHDGSYIIKSVNDIYVNRGLDATRRGKDINLQLDDDVPFSFSGTTLSGQKNESELGTGDFWFNTTLGRLFFRVDDNWVEV